MGHPPRCPCNIFHGGKRYTQLVGWYFLRKYMHQFDGQRGYAVQYILNTGHRRSHRSAGRGGRRGGLRGLYIGGYRVNDKGESWAFSSLFVDTLKRSKIGI
jgi:hypothetical protein